MQEQAQTITREQVIMLAETMPSEKLEKWYKYGLFIQYYSINTKTFPKEEAALKKEIEEWDAVSDEDGLNFERMLAEMS